MITAVEFRRHLHHHPELSFREVQTAQYIENCLNEAGISHLRIANTGVYNSNIKDVTDHRSL